MSSSDRILRNAHKSAARLHAAGFMDEVTMREFNAMCLPPLHNYSAADVQRIRASTKASQAVFASFLNVKKMTVAAWEQGTKKPSGPAIKLLDLIERKGLEALI